MEYIFIILLRNDILILKLVYLIGNNSAEGDNYIKYMLTVT